MASIEVRNSGLTAAEGYLVDFFLAFNGTVESAEQGHYKVLFKITINQKPKDFIMLLRQVGSDFLIVRLEDATIAKDMTSFICTGQNHILSAEKMARLKSILLWGNLETGSPSAIAEIDQPTGVMAAGADSAPLPTTNTIGDKPNSNKGNNATIALPNVSTDSDNIFAILPEKLRADVCYLFPQADIRAIGNHMMGDFHVVISDALGILTLALVILPTGKGIVKSIHYQECNKERGDFWLAEGEVLADRAHLAQYAQKWSSTRPWASTLKKRSIVLEMGGGAVAGALLSVMLGHFFIPSRSTQPTRYSSSASLPTSIARTPVPAVSAVVSVPAHPHPEPTCHEYTVNVQHHEVGKVNVVVSRLFTTVPAVGSLPITATSIATQMHLVGHDRKRLVTHNHRDHLWSILESRNGHMSPREHDIVVARICTTPVHQVTFTHATATGQELYSVRVNINSR